MDNIVLPGLLGIVVKIYDDLNDNNMFNDNEILLKNKDFINECLKWFMVFSLGYLSAKNFFLTFIFCIIIFTDQLSVILFKTHTKENPYGKPYEKSGLYFSIAFLIYSIFYKQNELMEIYNNKLIFYILLYVLLWILIEDKFFNVNHQQKKEDFSTKKLWIRSTAIPIFGALIFFNNKYNFTKAEIFNPIIYYTLGYTATSVLFQIYLLNTRGSDKENNKEKKEIKKKK